MRSWDVIEKVQWINDNTDDNIDSTNLKEQI